MTNGCGGNHFQHIYYRNMNPNEEKKSYSDESLDPLLLKGISVHYLQEHLLQEVTDHGLDVTTAKVYDLNNPNLKTKLGLIQYKGAKIICPRDGKIGAAYVDSIEDGKGFTAHANVMLSYTWGYRVKDIVSTLLSKCEEDGRDPKDTYVWICCLCNNQHRITTKTDPSFSDVAKISIQYPLKNSAKHSLVL